MNLPLTELTPEQAEKKRRHKIALIVAICHIVVIGGPLLWYLVVQWLKPEQPKVIQVKLVASSPTPSSSSSSNSQPSFEPTNTKFEPVKIPDPPSRVAQPKPNKRKVKTKPQQKKQPKKRPYLSPSEIRKSAKIVKIKKPKIVRTPKKVVVSRRPPAKTRAQLEAELREAMSQHANTEVGTSSRGIESAVVSYAQSVGAFLRPRWDQPSRTEVGGRQPEVTIRLRVSSSGIVISAKILQRSGVAAMDRSVQKLLNSLRQVPTPPRGIDHIDLIMALEDE